MNYRNGLPQLSDELFLTDGGLETTLIFHRGIDLPAFAAFVLLKDEQGTEEIRRYYESYLAFAKEHGAGFVLDSPTWRASPRWAGEVGYSDEELDEANRAGDLTDGGAPRPPPGRDLADRDQRPNRPPGRRL